MIGELYDDLEQREAASALQAALKRHLLTGVWETSGAGFDDDVDYFVVLQLHNKDPCMNPAAQ